VLWDPQQSHPKDYMLEGIKSAQIKVMYTLIPSPVSTHEVVVLTGLVMEIVAGNIINL